VPRPTGRQVGHDLLRRALAPAVAVWVVVVGVGMLLVGPLGDLPAEDAAVRAMEVVRTPALDTLTSLWSNVGATELVVAACAVTIGLLWWRTRRWWFAMVPAIAVAVQAAVFVTAAAVVGRERPEADALDTAPPTSSFPSGHVGASTAFYVTLALLAQRIEHRVPRWATTTACLLVPVLVAYARLYRAMHHPSDVVVGALNGLACAWLAWRYLRRRDRDPDDSAGDASTGTRP
jgi:undecaprenyl-diphosphatase